MIHGATTGTHGERLVGRPRTALYHAHPPPALGLCSLRLGLIPPLSLQGLSLHWSQHHLSKGRSLGRQCLAWKTVATLNSSPRPEWEESCKPLLNPPSPSQPGLPKRETSHSIPFPVHVVRPPPKPKAELSFQPSRSCAIPGGPCVSPTSL